MLIIDKSGSIQGFLNNKNIDKHRVMDSRNMWNREIGGFLCHCDWKLLYLIKKQQYYILQNRYQSIRVSGYVCIVLCRKHVFTFKVSLFLTFFMFM